MDWEARRNAFLYCKFRDEQYALYDAYAKENGILMNTFLVANALFYAKEGMNQKNICQATHQSKQTVSLIVKNLLREGYACLEEDPQDKRNKIVKFTKEGWEYFRRPVRHITQSEDRAMALFTKEEQERLVQLSRKFTENLKKLVRGEETGEE